MMCRLDKVAILGAESTGKSSLAAELASVYGTAWVPEYLREFVDVCGRVPFPDEQRLIAQTQKQREHDAAERLLAAGGGLLFCDTTPLMTAIYSEICFGCCDPLTLALAADHDYALTVVTDMDIPWVADGLQRDSPEAQRRIHARVLEELARRGIGFLLVSGTLAERVDAVNQALSSLR